MSNYTPAEVVYLTSWIEAQGATRMYEFFQEILRNKDASAKAFPHSPLAMVFERLLASEVEAKVEAPRGSLKRAGSYEDHPSIKRKPGRLQGSSTSGPVIPGSGRASVKRTGSYEDHPSIKRKSGRLQGSSTSGPVIPGSGRASVKRTGSYEDHPSMKRKSGRLQGSSTPGPVIPRSGRASVKRAGSYEDHPSIKRSKQA
jgi:hypothetical protein